MPSRAILKSWNTKFSEKLISSLKQLEFVLWTHSEMKVNINGHEKQTWSEGKRDAIDQHLLRKQPKAPESFCLMFSPGSRYQTEVYLSLALLTGILESLGLLHYIKLQNEGTFLNHWTNSQVTPPEGTIHTEIIIPSSVSRSNVFRSSFKTLKCSRLLQR